MLFFKRNRIHLSPAKLGAPIILAVAMLVASLACGGSEPANGSGSSDSQTDNDGDLQVLEWEWHFVPSWKPIGGKFGDGRRGSNTVRTEFVIQNDSGSDYQRVQAKIACYDNQEIQIGSGGDSSEFVTKGGKVKLEYYFDVNGEAESCTITEVSGFR